MDLVLSGCNGRMGHVIEELCSAALDLNIVAGFDILGTSDRSFPIFSAFSEFTGNADVVVDFSHPSALTSLLTYCIQQRLPVVLATTGYENNQLAEIEVASKTIPVFRSSNFSLGINVLSELVKQAATLLGNDFDIEIVERHHNRKVDSPSGTALLLAGALSSVLPYKPDYVYDRHCVRKPRDLQEIGISSIRGGTIAGDHEVIFAGRDETIELRHSAQSREVFAVGALKAARFLAECHVPGQYGMSELLSWLWQSTSHQPEFQETL